MRVLCLFLVALVLGFVVCEEDSLQLGSFEGAFTSINGNGPAFGLWMCQDGNIVHGSYDEVGILIGSVSDDKQTLSGQFFTAGTGPCVRGTFSFDITTDGFDGIYTCQFLEGDRPWSASRTSVFRPPDSQCALLYGPDNLNFEGEWVDSNSLQLDMCFVDPDDDDITVKASVQHKPPTGAIQDWYIEGHYFNSGKIIQGTWYTDLSAGAILLYLRDNGNIDYFWWTGLVFDAGQTYIDFLQLGDLTQHGRGTYSGPRKEIVFDDCIKYEVLSAYVVANLPRDDDDNYYYFVETQYLDHELFNYVVEDDSVTLIASFFVIVVGLIVALI